MTSIVRFQLSTGGVVLVVGGMAFFAALMFIAGMLVASPPAPKVAVPSLALPKPALPAVASPPVPAAAASMLATTTAGAAAPAAQPTAFTLRVGVYTTSEEAQQAIADLASRKLQASVVELPTSRATILYTVVIGRYADRTAAVTAAGALEKNHGIEADVVPLG